MGGIVIEGRVVFPPGDRPAEAAALVVRVEDVSLADAPSTVVAQQRVADPRADGRGVPFRIEVPALDPRRRYTLRAHVDVSGSGTVTPGDYVSTTSSPVDPERPVTELEVRRV